MNAKGKNIWRIVILSAVFVIPVLLAIILLNFQERNFSKYIYNSISEYVVRIIDATITEAQVSAVGFDSVATYAKLSESLGNTTPELLCSLEMKRKLETINRSVQYIAHVNIVNEKRELICGEPYKNIQPVMPAVDIGSGQTKLISAITNIQDKLYYIISVKLYHNIYYESYVLLDRRNLMNLPFAFSTIKEMSLVSQKGDRLFEDERSNILFKNYSNAVQNNLDPHSLYSSVFPYGVQFTFSRDSIFYEIQYYYYEIIFASIVIGMFLFMFLKDILVKKIKNQTQNLSCSVDVEIEKAILNQEFIPYYQPIISLATGEITGCEVLLRWHKANGRIIMPLSFLDKIDNDIYAHKVTQLIMNSVAHDMVALLSANTHFTIAFNIFSREFSSLDIVDYTSTIFEKYKIPFHNIVLEITEHKELQDVRLASNVLTILRENGFKIALDDIGIGHSNLIKLQELPIDFIKIDKQFTDKIVNTENVPIIDGLVQIAHAMHVKVIVEGIETQQQFKYLKNLHVYAGQGFAISPALPIDEFLKFIEHVGIANKNNSKKLRKG